MVEPVKVRAIATPPPWSWTNWMKWVRRDQRDRYYQKLRRVRLQDLDGVSVRDWRRQQAAAADVTFYTPNQIRHIIRWDPSAGLAPASPPPWPRDVLRGWQPWRYEPDATHIKLESPTAGTTRHPTGWWEGAGRGLPLGAALLAAILLLLRAADRCLHTNLFKLPVRRRQSEEWPTPNVMATSLAVRMTSDFSSVRPASPPPNEQVDLPPPYSECAGDPSATHLKPEHEEPPPPYSACYVAYSNPKDGAPSVHFLTQQCQNLFANYEAGPSSVHDTGQTIEEDTGPPNEEEASDIYHGADDDDEVRDSQIEVSGSEVENTHNESQVELKDATPAQTDRYLVV